MADVRDELGREAFTVFGLLGAVAVGLATLTLKSDKRLDFYIAAADAALIAITAGALVASLASAGGRVLWSKESEEERRQLVVRAYLDLGKRQRRLRIAEILLLAVVGLLVSGTIWAAS